MDEAEEIKELVKKYINNKLSEAELNSFLLKISDASQKELFLNELKQYWLPGKYKAIHNATDWEALYAKYIPAEQNPRPAKIIKLSKKRWWYGVAAVLCVLIVSAFLVSHFINQNNEQRQAIAKSAKGTGSKNAVLTLANGKQVALKFANDGTIAEESGVIVNKVKDGQLKYQIAPNAKNVSIQMETNTLSTPRGGQYQITLSDGTQIWLNAESSLKIPTTFSKDKRVVYLTGEAFFDVKHANKWPFIIHTSGGVSTRVLGTAFDIKAYANQKMSVSVKRGLVQVSKNQKVLGILKVGQQIQVDEKLPIQPIIQPVKKDNIAVWTEGKLNYDAMTFGEVTQDLQRTFNVQISLQNAQISNEKITCTFNRKDGLQKILETLCMLTGTHFTQKDDVYKIN